MKRSLAPRQSARLATQAAELAIAAPIVVAHRLARMASANATALSSRDQLEFQRMGAEKLAAFNASWQAMGLQTLQGGQRLGWSLANTWWRALLRSPPAAGAWFNPFTAFSAPSQATLHQLQAAQLAVWSKGLAPVHQRAVANARRLSRKRTR